MKAKFEEQLPYILSALAVPALFYGIYFAKMLIQPSASVCLVM